MNFRQVHLDFHTSEHIPGIGADFDKHQFQNALRQGHVDSITVFSKCHHGWSYHPTDANRMHPNLGFDLLAAQIEAAHEIGVKTPVYISAGLDEKIAREHPEWLVRKRDESTMWRSNFSEPGYHLLCFNSPYLELLTQQVREVCKNYDADGIFMDITAPRVCYCQNCVRTMRDRGLDPYEGDNATRLGEETYANYTRAIREAVDSVKPGLPIFHNSGATPRGRRDLAAMSSHNEIESLPTSSWGYDNYPMISRYVQPMGGDFLGMTGKFHLSWGEFGGYKHPNALIWESALSVAQGGKCSIGDQLHPSGKMDPETYRIIGEAYARIEAREPWLDNVRGIADVGLLSYDAYLLRHPEDKAADPNARFTDVGALRLLMEGHYLFDVLDEESDFSPYKLLILPDNIRIDELLEKKLRAYINGGGKLLAAGCSGLDAKDRFVFDLGVRYDGHNKITPCFFSPILPMGESRVADYVIYGASERVHLTEGDLLASLKLPYFARTAEHFCSHRHAPAAPEKVGVGIAIGKEGAYIAAQIFRDYAMIGTQFVKQAFCTLLDRCLGNQKTLRVPLPTQGVATLMEQPAENRLILHLLYAPRTVKGENKIEVIEDCVPLYRVPVRIRVGGRRIQRVYTAPTGEAIDFTVCDGMLCFEVPSVQIHSMTVIEAAEDESL